MSVDVASEVCPRRSLRRTSLEQKRSSVESTTQKSITVNGKKRSIDDDDAPILDSSFSDNEEGFEDEDEEDSGGPPPLKKVARTSANGGGIIKWKTATGAPKQLAFKKVGGPPSNGSSFKPTTASVPAAPNTLATALAGLLPEPTFSSGPPIYTNNAKRVFLKPAVTVPRLTNPTPVQSSSSIIRRRPDKVNNEVCNDCVKALPNLRRSLGRLEARMEAVTSMIKQIVNKHSQQNVAYARTPNVMPPRDKPSIASPSPSLNGNRVAGNPTAMRFVPITGRTTASPSGNSVMRKFVTDRVGRLSPSSLMYRMISRGLLTYKSPSFTVEEYYKQAPNVIKAHTLKQVQEVMEDLFNNKLYKKCDPRVETMDEECIFEKERDLPKLSRLADYGVNTADFLSGCFDD
ncbi:hypothetical protein PRIPAC_93310 [Pristionchus pacificus]|nr:hypothetical protein PRIPAC_93310 [Pristionchus pacificus]